MHENSVRVPKRRLGLTEERSYQGLVEGGRTKISNFKLELDELYNLHKAKIG